ncbi:thiamine phosphate synthase [Telmatospirillum siberiense]|uniref:Thiamine phosphate synthase n=1 Tax=Telmatospirillum siberiense TaxID=382514 RepID=A0A2N3PN06_9PROT|nr:thiamine phosphate synthase [Telmatospirillum siberiense]PKU21785.1 thiamine phosphate synthase [Telmatospirillum siberiense]
MRTLTDLARHLNFGGGRYARRSARLPPIILVTDDVRLPDPLAAAARLPFGSVVIYRHYQAPDRAVLAARLAKLCKARRLHLLIAGDFGLAVRLNCGLHLPEGLAACVPVRVRLWHRRRHPMLTAAAHGRKGLLKAARLKATAALLSPVFPTLSHPGEASLGLLGFRRLVHRTAINVYGLGGITVATVTRLVGSGAAGIAAIGGLGGSDRTRE